MTVPRRRLLVSFTSLWWCRLTAVATFVVLGAIALAACGTDGDDTGAAEPRTDVAADDDGADTADGADDGDGADTADAVDDDGTDTADAADDDGLDVGADEGSSAELFPDVVGATATLDGDGTWTFSATLSSPYDSPERYADAWRVIGSDGTVYGVRELLHDHAGEQPFTRSQSGIEIPVGVEVVTVEGRDQVSGWGGATVEVALDR